jgi:hypothetical protein
MIHISKTLPEYWGFWLLDVVAMEDHSDYTDRQKATWNKGVVYNRKRVAELIREGKMKLES